MIKILMILSIAAMIVTGVFGWQNRQTFVQERELKHDTNDKINKEKAAVESLARVTKDRHDVLTGNIAERNLNEEQLRTAKNDLAASNTKLAGLEADVMSKQTQLASLQKKLDDFAAMLINVFPGETIKIDDIEPKYKELQKIVVDGKDELSALEKELATLQENLANRIKDREGHEARQATRKQQFERNTLNARITQVSNDWGFLVFDAGSKQEIAGDTQLMVVRPGMGSICKLSIIEIEENKTTANIVQNTLVTGVQVQVGDRVMVAAPRE